MYKSIIFRCLLLMAWCRQDMYKKMFLLKELYMKRFILGSILSCMVVGQTLCTIDSKQASDFLSGMARSALFPSLFGSVGYISSENSKTAAIASAFFGIPCGIAYFWGDALRSIYNNEYTGSYHRVTGFLTGTALIGVAGISYLCRSSQRANTQQQNA